MFERGDRVAEAARARFPGGVRIAGGPADIEARLAATRSALDSGAPAVYEAAFLEDEVFVSVDVLERQGPGFSLVDVKSALRLRDEHVPDLALQVHVVRRAGVPVHRAEVMHLDRECCAPDLSNLFTRVDVTPEVELLLPQVPGYVEAQRRMLDGGLPRVAPGAQCDAPSPCPFAARCWPERPRDHVSAIWRIGDRAGELASRGVVHIADVPPDFPLAGPAARQVRAARTGRLVVERGLAGALARWRRPIAFLELACVQPAVPVWPGCHPYDPVAVLLSCHVEDGDGYRHAAWLASDAADPREALARSLLAACQGAGTILAWDGPFERGRIEELAQAIPREARRLVVLAARIEDLGRLVRDHVYHPDFGGRFTLDAVLPALLPGEGLDDLPGLRGGAEAAALERLVLHGAHLDAAERAGMRRRVAERGERDTWGMALVTERLRELALPVRPLVVDRLP